MNRIQRKVVTARRRLFLARFGKTLSIMLFIAWIAATIAILVPALRWIGVDHENWAYGWIGGSTAAAVIIALLYSWATQPSLAAVASEVDHRFGLHERLSSSLSLDRVNRET